MLSRSAVIMAEVIVKHEQAKSRFIGTLPQISGACVLDYRVNSNSVVDFYRTVTDAPLQGKGVAAAVVTAGFKWARESKLKVTGSCSYVESFIQKHPEWSDISKL